MAIDDTSITFSVANAPNLVYIRTTITGLTVGDADFIFDAQTNSSGRLWISLVSPGMLGAGTYTSSVKFEMCLDNVCAEQISGSPKIIAVTYQVSGGALPNTQVRWSENQITDATMTTAETNVPHTLLRISVDDMPLDGLWVRHFPSATGMMTGAVFKQTSLSTRTGSARAEFDVTLKPPAALGSGVFTDSKEFEVCFDSACANPVPGGKHTLSLNVFIPATEGLEFTRKVTPTSTLATGVTWSPANQKLYVATNLTNLKIIELDPVTMVTNTGATLETSVGSIRLGPMAVSSDGSNLFVASRQQHFVYRLLLPSLTLDKAISLGDWGSYPIFAEDLATIAGQPQSFIVAEATNHSDNGVFVYDDETPRATFVPKDPAQAFGPPRWLVPAPTVGTFFSQSNGPSFPQTNTMDLLTLDANGITTTSRTPTGHPFYYPRPVRIGTKMYTLNGKIMDAASGAEIGSLPGFGSTVAHAMVGDEARGYLYVWTDYAQKDYILKYDVATEKLLAYAPVYGGPTFPPGGGRSMTMWGNEGVAITDGAQVLVFSGTYFSTYRGEPTQ